MISYVCENLRWQSRCHEASSPRHTCISALPLNCFVHTGPHCFRLLSLFRGLVHLLYETVLELEMQSTVYIFNSEILQRTKIEKLAIIKLMLVILWFSNSYPCIDLLIIDCFHIFRTLNTVHLFPTCQVVLFIQNSL